MSTETEHTTDITMTEDHQPTTSEVNQQINRLMEFLSSCNLSERAVNIARLHADNIRQAAEIEGMKQALHIIKTNKHE